MKGSHVGGPTPYTGLEPRDVMPFLVHISFPHHNIILGNIFNIFVFYFVCSFCCYLSFT